MRHFLLITFTAMLCVAPLWGNAGQAQEVPFIELKGHTSSIGSVAFSFDGKKIITSSADCTARIWDAESGKELKRFRVCGAMINSTAISPDGKKVVAGSVDDIAHIWDADSEKELKELEGHENFVNSVAFSPDGKKVITGGMDNTVRIWDAELSSANFGKELKKLKGHTDWVTSAVFSSDGKKVVTGSGDKTARIWDANSGKELKRLGGTSFFGQMNGHRDVVESAAFSPDGKKVVSGSWDKTARIWDLERLSSPVQNF